MSHATCQRCAKPGRPERWNGRIRTLGICFVCGYGAAERDSGPTASEREERRLNRAGLASGDLFRDATRTDAP